MISVTSWIRHKHSFTSFNVNISQIMDGRDRTFHLLQVFLCFFVFASTEETKQNCSQVQCPGPLIYYNDVGCTPVYKNEGDCCAYKYNCDHLYARSPNKCYIKDRSYEIGEFASQEDIKFCDKACVCVSGKNSTRFWCFDISYEYDPHFDVSCYLKRNIHECGPGIPTCPKNDSEIPQCIVDRYRYRDGQSFKPIKEPWKWCVCQEGYKGDNIEPFCITTGIRCGIEYYENIDIANKNAPIYRPYGNSAISCTNYWRRQNANDTVISNAIGPTAPDENSSGEEDLICKFGNLTMNIGDELSQNIYNYPNCARCVCEVPPTPTCKIDYYNYLSEPALRNCFYFNDTVISNPNNSASPAENHSGETDPTCKFGDLTMNIGDQLSPSTDYDSPRVNCTCEVPPTPTCKLLNSSFVFW
ncbi:uncharacterized protein LOC107271896 [Cephus cinctus]|uniref:Uncharacterized protein LOC107271896 n=1 Tax=Cephus cinctus TaxID=211228 RepID=A0AAJ7FQZ5_CEPCN|nr:uncharacterized protein LOC107271896 [Cephus cinctus]